MDDLRPFICPAKSWGWILHGVENLFQGEVLFVQAAYNFLNAAKVWHCSIETAEISGIY